MASGLSHRVQTRGELLLAVQDAGAALGDGGRARFVTASVAALVNRAELTV